MGRVAKGVVKNINKAEEWKQKWENGKALIMKVTSRLKTRENEIEVLTANLKASQAIIGALAVEVRTFKHEVEKGDSKVFISKALIKEIIENYDVAAVETEDKLGFIIEIKEAKTNVDTDESKGSDGATEEAEQVQ